MTPPCSLCDNEIIVDLESYLDHMVEHRYEAREQRCTAYECVALVEEGAAGQWSERCAAVDTGTY